MIHALMNIEGTYKVNIEQTVRKMGESEDATIARMLSYVGLRRSDIPPDPNKEGEDSEAYCPAAAGRACDDDAPGDCGRPSLNTQHGR